MNKIFNLSLIILIFIFFSCSKKNNIPAPKKSENTLFNTEVTNKDSTSLIKENNNKIEKNIEEIISVDSITTNNNKIEVTNTNFYELEKSIEKILLKISFLEKQLLLNEDSAPSTSFAEKLKTLIDGPPEKHQILLKNESIIEGFIEKDDETNLLVMTSVGRLTIDKNEIEFIEKITTLEPDIIFIGHGLEKKFENYYEFSGKVLNQGTLRGDFVRVIYKLWADDTNLLFSDSAFVDGNKIKYEGGIVTDTALNPNKSARYTVVVPINNENPITYITREIHWTKYD